MSFKFNTKVVGVTFDGRQSVIEQIAAVPITNTDIALIREPTNTFDTNAIQVVVRSKNGAIRPIGYLNKDVAKTIAPIMDQGRATHATINNISGGGNYNYGINIAVTVS